MREKGLKMPREKGRVKKILGIFSPFGVLILIAFLVGIVSEILRAVFNLYGMADIVSNNNVYTAIHSYVNNEIEWSNLMGIVMQIAISIIFYRLYKKNNDIKKEFRKEIFSGRYLGIITLLGVGDRLAIMSALILILPHFEKVMQEYTEHINGNFEGNQVLCYIGVILLAPISEELMMRGVIMKKAEKLFPFAVANLIQALLFGIMHFNIVQSTYSFFGGIIFGYVAYKYQSVLASIILHAICNLFGTLLPLYDSVYIAPIYLIVGSGLLFVTLKQISRTRIPQEHTEESDVLLHP